MNKICQQARKLLVKSPCTARRADMYKDKHTKLNENINGKAVLSVQKLQPYQFLPKSDSGACNSSHLPMAPAMWQLLVAVHFHYVWLDTQLSPVC